MFETLTLLGTWTLRVARTETSQPIVIAAAPVSTISFLGPPIQSLNPSPQIAKPWLPKPVKVFGAARVDPIRI